MEVCKIIACFNCEQVQLQGTCWKYGKQDVARDFKKFRRNIALRGTTLVFFYLIAFKKQVLLILE